MNLHICSQENQQKLLPPELHSLTPVCTKSYKSTILPLNSPEMKDFQPQILYFWKKILRQKENLLTG